MFQVPVTRSQLETWVSPTRLATYAARTAPAQVVDEYTWAVHLNAAFMELITHVEVMLRNVIHAQLTTQHSGPGPWFDDAGYVRLNKEAIGSVRRTRGRITKSGHTPTADRIVAGLSFDFWRFLFVKKHQIDIWRRVRHGFNGLPGSRRASDHFTIVEQAVTDVYELRNRVAHHEPIRLHRALRDHDAVLQLAGYVDPAARLWLESVSSVLQILAARPGHPPRPDSLENYARRRRRELGQR